jgi:hypothetical protein
MAVRKGPRVAVPFASTSQIELLHVEIRVERATVARWRDSLPMDCVAEICHVRAKPADPQLCFTPIRRCRLFRRRNEVSFGVMSLYRNVSDYWVVCADTNIRIMNATQVKHQDVPGRSRRQGARARVERSNRRRPAASRRFGPASSVRTHPLHRREARVDARVPGACASDHAFDGKRRERCALMSMKPAVPALRRLKSPPFVSARGHPKRRPLRSRWENGSLASKSSVTWGMCMKMGSWWVHLRMCLECGHVGCCDSSPNKHATKHFHATGHPI